MAVGTAIAIGAQLAPLLFSLFGGGREEEIDPEEQFQRILRLLGPQFEPIINALIQQGELQGASAAQRISGVIGSAGGGQTGVGATSQSVATGLQGVRAGQAQLQGQAAKIQAATSIFNSGQFNPRTFVKPPTGLQNFQSAFGLASIGGQNPVEQLVNLFRNFNKPNTPNFNPGPPDLAAFGGNQG